MKLHIHGIINYGLKLQQLYEFYDHWKYGADYVVNILHKHLDDIKNTIDAAKWPHILYF
jgi:hypothetical protein